MNILPANNTVQLVPHKVMPVQQNWQDIVTLYCGFEAFTYSKASVIAACVEEATLRADSEIITSVSSQILSCREQKLWKEHGLDSTRKLHWLMGRIAAKRAIYKLVMSECGTEIPTLDISSIEIFNTEDGNPYSNCTADDTVAAYLGGLQISIAHTDGFAVAAAGYASRLGVDVERIDRYGLNGTFPELAFCQEEKAQIEQYCDSSDPAILTRIWTAKEAAGKAAKLGLGGILKHCRFANCNQDLSLITLHLSNAKGEPSLVDVCTVQEHEFYLSLAIS